MLRPVQAPVRPRIVSPATHESLPLEDEVQVWLDKGGPYCLQIVGGPGSGKSTALAHLADEFHGLARITFLDTDDWLLPPSTGTLSRFVIFAGNETPAEHP